MQWSNLAKCGLFFNIVSPAVHTPLPSTVSQEYDLEKILLGRLELYKCKRCLLLKGKFSTGIEGALASTLNRDFNWKQLPEIILCIFLLMFSKFI